jgi:phage tail-like protein
MTVTTAHRLLALLPAIYREDAFLGRYLAAFESMLLELESKVDSIATHFDPRTAPDEFLPWLASWMAFSVQADLARDKQRAFLAQLIPLYRRRGTAGSLQELLTIFTTGKAEVKDDLPEPNTFKVKVTLTASTPAESLRQRTIAHALIEMEKPAHTAYTLEVEFPSMQIKTTSQVGVNTLIGPRRNP